MTLANLHAHTNYTDGKNSAAEMAAAAFDAGYSAFGFSEHSYTPMMADFPGLAPERFESYRADVLRERERYAGRMEIFLGMEQDILSGGVRPGLDYSIGSVHAFYGGGKLLEVDESEARQVSEVAEVYGGDYYRYIRSYYENEARVISVTHADIVGHFDLVTKFNEGGRLFDEDDPRYLESAFSALDELLKSGAIFEINTGAVCRGYRSTPYPSRAILRRIFERGGRITLSGDFHDAAAVARGLADAADYASGCGFREIWTLGRGGFFAAAL